MKAHIAVLDDESRMAEIVAMLLRRESYKVQTFTDPVEFVEKLDELSFDLLVTDLKMPGLGGLEVLKRVREKDGEVPVILLTAHATIKTAIEAMRMGAFDYLEKPFENDQIKSLVARALDHTRLTRENRYLRAELRSRYAFDQVVCESQSMLEVLDLSRRAAKSRATVLISGDSGTGKELIARAIHYHSPRVGQPFIAVNCKALSEGVLESELFGHEKGSYTGAAKTRAGLFERADTGTIFLDEIGEIDLHFQAKLLRVLQEREITRVGGDESVSIDVRVVAATNLDLKEQVKKGEFREDLYFRLAVIPIRLASLKDRKEDILPLARMFLARFKEELGREILGWTKAVETWLLNHPWPGNVRELENTLERATVLARENEIQMEDLLLEESAGLSLSPDDDPLTLHQYLDQMAASRIRKTLEQVQYKRIKAAEKLGIDRATLYRLMKKLGI